MKRLSLILCAISMLGCGPSAPAYKLSPFSGVVKMDGKPLANATVIFTPKTAASKSPGGFAVTDANGKFEILSAAPSTAKTLPKGVPAGDYYVAFSKFVKPDGSEIPPDSKETPADSGAIDSIPQRYSTSSETKLEVTVPATGGTQDFDIESK